MGIRAAQQRLPPDSLRSQVKPNALAGLVVYAGERGSAMGGGDQDDTQSQGASLWGMGTLIGIGAGFGLVLGLLLNNMVMGMLAGAAIGTVAGAVSESLRRKNVSSGE